MEAGSFGQFLSQLSSLMHVHSARGFAGIQLISDVLMHSAGGGPAVS